MLCVDRDGGLAEAVARETGGLVDIVGMANTASLTELDDTGKVYRMIALR